MATCNPARAAAGLDCDEQSKDLSRSSNASTQILCNSPVTDPILSKKRWSIMVAICVFGLSLTLAGDTAPILDQILKLLDLKVDSYVYIGQIFTYLVAILAVPSAMLLDRFGIRTTIHVAACFFVLSGTFTSLLYFTELPGWSHYKMYFYIIARIFGTECFALFFLLPLKVSETWFSESERSAAWMTMFLQFEIGTCLVSFIYPRLIVNIGDFKKLAYVNIACVTITLVTCVGLVTKSEPANPPSVRAASKDVAPIYESLKRIVKHRDILLHMIHSSIFSSLSLTMNSVLQNILSSIGHSQVFAGNYMLINAVVSAILSIMMACFVHKIHNATMACKLGSILQAAQFVLLLIAIASSWSGWTIVGMSIVLTICRSWTIPNYNDMTAHLACGVVSPPTMIGLSLAVSPVITSVIQVTFAYLIETQGKMNNYHNSLLFLIGICIINEAIYQMFFEGKSSSQSDDSVPVVDAESPSNLRPSIED